HRIVVNRMRRSGQRIFSRQRALVPSRHFEPRRQTGDDAYRENVSCRRPEEVAHDDGALAIELHDWRESSGKGSRRRTATTKPCHDLFALDRAVTTPDVRPLVGRI